MLSHLILIVATAGPGQTGPAGQVSSASGTLTIRRGSQTYTAKLGAEVVSGDRLETSDRGGAGILLDDEHVITMGAATTAVFQGVPGGRVVAIDKGQVRVVAGKASALTVTTGRAEAEVRHGILRASAIGARFRVERGFAMIRAADRPTTRLDEGNEVSASGSGRPILVSAGAPGWTVNPAGVAIADSRVLLAMQAPATTDKPAIPAPPATPATPTPKPDRRPDLPKPGNPATNPPGPEIPPAPDDTEPTRSGPIPPAPADEASRSTANPVSDAENPDNPANRPYQPIAVAQPASLSSVSLALGSISSSSSAASSGAFNSDAQQDTVNLMFPGNVHVVTAQSTYQLFDVRLSPRDRFPTAPQFWSIGIGPTPTTQVSTSLRTASNAPPDVLRIPRTNAYLVNLAQYGIKDPATTSSNNTIGVTGFLGQNPTAPLIRGATPLLDSRAAFNQKLTFAVGELALSTAPAKFGSSLNPVLSIRRSDQDRQIIKSATGNDNLDKVTPNPSVNFIQVHDAKFFPNVPLVYVPANPPTPTLRNPPTYHGLDLLRKAAATTLLADSLAGYAQRTGQTRFVINKQIVDITGYQRAGTSLMRSGHAAPGMSGGPVKAIHHLSAGSPNRAR